MNQILENLEESVGSVPKLADLTKAFDTVDHKIIPEQCELHGLRGKNISLLRSDLENCKKYVSYNNSISDTKTIYYGVPQMSVLGRLLFLLYINDLPNVCRLKQVVLLADDCALYTTTETGNQQQVNSDTSNAKKMFLEN